MQHRLDGGEHVVLGDEAHLQIELVELAGAAVGARVLVAETGRDLEIAVEARHHDELLELLRRLRQRVELARMQPRRHQEVARAFRRRRGQDRRLEFGEALLDHPPADRRDDLRAQRDVLVQPLAAQIEEAVFEPRLFGIFEYRRTPAAAIPAPGSAPSTSSMRISTSPVGRSVFTVSGVRATTLPVSVSTHSGARLVGFGEGGLVRLDHALGDAVMVAQVDEQQPAMVAPAIDPAGQPHRLADMLLAQLAAGVGAIGVHVEKPLKTRLLWRVCGEPVKARSQGRLPLSQLAA